MQGLKQVSTEGWTEKTRGDYQVKIASLRAVEKQMPALRKQLDEGRLLMVQMQAAGRDKTERYDQVVGIEKEINGLVEKHRLEMLAMGAARRLLVVGELGVFPLEKANPQEGTQTGDNDDQNAQGRNDAIVRNLLAHGPVTIIILGGDHDLSEGVKRVTTTGFQADRQLRGGS